MTWTDERVETLKKLWHDGLSASTIAQNIGEVTRNAVIGKVHRLGLAGRATQSRIRSAVPRGPAIFVASGRSKKRGALPHAARAPQLRSPAAYRHHAILPELAPPPVDTVTIATLTGDSCRWPNGDPKTPGFHFCGRPARLNCPYCDHHAAIAYR
jgi:GcrA cell cycle regulator